MNAPFWHMMEWGGMYGQMTKDIKYMVYNVWLVRTVNKINTLMYYKFCVIHLM